MNKRTFLFNFSPHLFSLSSTTFFNVHVFMRSCSILYEFENLFISQYIQKTNCEQQFVHAFHSIFLCYSFYQWFSIFMKSFILLCKCGNNLNYLHMIFFLSLHHSELLHCIWISAACDAIHRWKWMMKKSAISQSEFRIEVEMFCKYLYDFRSCIWKMQMFYVISVFCMRYGVKGKYYNWSKKSEPQKLILKRLGSNDFKIQNEIFWNMICNFSLKFFRIICYICCRTRKSRTYKYINRLVFFLFSSGFLCFAFYI